MEKVNKEARTKRNAVLGMIFFLFEMYFLIGGISLGMKATGADIAYIPFWHEPWRLMLQLFFS